MLETQPVLKAVNHVQSYGYKKSIVNEAEQWYSDNEEAIDSLKDIIGYQ